MQWNSLSEFMAMGGYGVYVWPSFGMSALCMIWEAMALCRRHSAARASLFQAPASTGGTP